MLFLFFAAAWAAGLEGDGDGRAMPNGVYGTGEAEARQVFSAAEQRPSAVPWRICRIDGPAPSGAGPGGPVPAPAPSRAESRPSADPAPKTPILPPYLLRSPSGRYLGPRLT